MTRLCIDEERTGILATRGLRILRVRNEDVLQDVASVLERIVDACGHEPNPPPRFGEGPGERFVPVAPGAAPLPEAERACRGALSAPVSNPLGVVLSD